MASELTELSVEQLVDVTGGGTAGNMVRTIGICIGLLHGCAIGNMDSGGSVSAPSAYGIVTKG